MNSYRFLLPKRNNYIGIDLNPDGAHIINVATHLINACNQ